VRNKKDFSVLTACKDFIVDDCDEELTFGKTIKILDVETAELCQRFCKEKKYGQCKFFIFQRFTKICLLSIKQEKPFLQHCRKTSGPKLPKKETCNTTEPCFVRKWI